MENSGRPYRARQSREKGASTSDKAETWRTHDHVRGQNIRPEGGQQGRKNQTGQYWASPKKGGLGPLSHSPGAGYRGGHSPSQKDDLRWFPGPEKSSWNRDDNWRERSQQQQQHWRRTTQGEGPKEDREQGRRENMDDGGQKGGEDSGY